MCCKRLAAIGERTLFKPHATSTDCGMRARDGGAIGYAFIWGMTFSENRCTLFRVMP